MTHPQSLMEIPRFASLTEQGISWLTDHAFYLTKRTGDIIFDEGQNPAFFYLILSGRVRICRFQSKGAELVLGVFGRGQSIGEVVLLAEKPYPATAQCLDKTVLFCLSRADYFEAYRGIPEFGTESTIVTAKRAVHLERRVAELGAGSVENRIETAIQNFVSSGYDVGTAGFLLRSKMSKKELANHVAARYETVVRVLSKWTADGEIIYEGDQIVIPFLSRFSPEDHTLEPIR